MIQQCNTWALYLSVYLNVILNEHKKDISWTCMFFLRKKWFFERSVTIYSVLKTILWNITFSAIQIFFCEAKFMHFFITNHCVYLSFLSTLSLIILCLSLSMTTVHYFFFVNSFQLNLQIDILGVLWDHKENLFSYSNYLNGMKWVYFQNIDESEWSSN